MRVLALDTALGACSVCVYDTSERRLLATASTPMVRGHADALMPMLEALIGEVEGRFSGIDRVGVTVGPGSYTGIRVAVSAARAIGLALTVPVVGVSTLSALAAPLIGAPEKTVIAAAIDARNDLVYLQVVNASGRALITPRQLGLRDAVRVIGSGPVRLVGSGAVRLAAEAWLIGLQAVVADAPDHPDISWVARLAALSDPAVAPPKPVYLRAADATPAGGTPIERIAPTRSVPAVTPA